MAADSIPSIRNVARYGPELVPSYGGVQVVPGFRSLFCEIAMVSASTLFMLRAIALWGRALVVVIPLLFLHLCQWGLHLYNGIVEQPGWITVDLGPLESPAVSGPWFVLQVQFIYCEFGWGIHKS